ncbi:hypothetical protein SAMN05216593_114124 [Pseudomonas asturiensis]|uniref:Uncharacterized protein n=1 Tax=Pseudomonas asturiensis TaxID=1190415 RepID=A0A1M7PWT5_9PSED|nr:hypothetical protein SAMN05216593_114124 [Pseudomonas asturiensis]
MAYRKMAQEPDTSRVLEPRKDTGEIAVQWTVRRFAVCQLAAVAWAGGMTRPRITTSACSKDG